MARFGKFQLPTKGVNPPPFLMWPIFGKNPIASHFAETTGGRPGPVLVCDTPQPPPPPPPGFER